MTSSSEQVGRSTPIFPTPSFLTLSLEVRKENIKLFVRQIFAGFSSHDEVATDGMAAYALQRLKEDPAIASSLTDRVAKLIELLVHACPENKMDHLFEKSRHHETPLDLLVKSLFVTPQAIRILVLSCSPNSRHKLFESGSEMNPFERVVLRKDFTPEQIKLLLETLFEVCPKHIRLRRNMRVFERKNLTVPFLKAVIEACPHPFREKFFVAGPKEWTALHFLMTLTSSLTVELLEYLMTACPDHLRSRLFSKSGQTIPPLQLLLKRTDLPLDTIKLLSQKLIELCPYDMLLDFDPESNPLHYLAHQTKLQPGILKLTFELYPEHLRDRLFGPDRHLQTLADLMMRSKLHLPVIQEFFDICPERLLDQIFINHPLNALIEGCPEGPPLKTSPSATTNDYDADPVHSNGDMIEAVVKSYPKSLRHHFFLPNPSGRTPFSLLIERKDLSDHCKLALKDFA